MRFQALSYLVSTLALAALAAACQRDAVQPAPSFTAAATATERTAPAAATATPTVQSTGAPRRTTPPTVGPSPLPEATPAANDDSASTIPGDGISRNAWVQDRISAVRLIWGFTERGTAWMESYDFRQMVGQPAWYGSHGAGGWAGAGEANPRIVLHELSHSSWGAFHVEGVPGLPADSPAESLRHVLAQFHADLDRFLRQPPDSFEPLRDRFRNLPNLVKGGYPDLHHFGEAEMVNMTGGNMALIPPILRKYFSPYLAPEGVAAEQVPDWAAAMAWIHALTGEERRIAEEVFGLQHIPREPYQGLSPPARAVLDRTVIETFTAEERQRLRDFAQQFDLVKARQFALVDAAGVDRGFSFWREYLRDKKRLHQRYPEVLNGHTSARARELGATLDFYLSIDGDPPESQAAALRGRPDDTLAHEFAVLLKPLAIVELYGGGTGDGGLDRVISERARTLAEMARRVEEVMTAARTSPALGAAALETWLGELSDNDIRSGINVAVDLMRETGGDITERMFPLLSDDTLRRLLAVKPDQARAYEIGPERLLRAVGIVPGAPVRSIASGAQLLSGNSSGNFAIDRPYDLAVYEAIESVGATDPAAAIALLQQSGMRLLPWVERGSGASLDVMWSRPRLAAGLLASVPGPRETPEMLIHALIAHDPELAATILLQMEEAGIEGIAGRGLMAIAFDSYWTTLGGGPGVDPNKDGRFLIELYSLRGAEWLKRTLRQAALQVQADVASANTDPQFLTQLTRTLHHALSPTHPTLAAQLLAQIPS